MDLRLRDKVYIVTGGSSGIGEAISRELAVEGAKVAIVGRRKEKLNRLVKEIKESGGGCIACLAELTELEDCEEVVTQTLKQYGQIDGLINNAGVNDGIRLEQGTTVEFMESLKKNVGHYFTMAHLALPALKKTKGTIVNISSKVSLTGQGGTSGYAASKGGVNALTREWAVDLLPYSIRVNAVVPAEVWTPQYDYWLSQTADPEEKLKNIVSKIPFEKRFTTSEEIADTVLFLLSDRSSHTTGQIIVVDGGYVHLDRALQ